MRPEQGKARRSVQVDAEDREAAFEKAVRVLNAASQTSSGLHAKLKRAGYSDSAAGDACRRAVELGYVNDRAYAAALVGKRIRQGRGKALITRELGHKGIDGDLVGEAMNEVDPADELRSAVELAARLLRRNQTELDPHKRREKVLSGLARRGFSGQVSRGAFSIATSPEGIDSGS